MFFILYLYVESHPDCTTGSMTPCIFHDNVAMRVFNPLSLSLFPSLLPLIPHPKTRSSTRDSEKREKEGGKKDEEP